MRFNTGSRLRCIDGSQRDPTSMIVGGKLTVFSFSLSVGDWIGFQSFLVSRELAKANG
jgi:hypothetical protein